MRFLLRSLTALVGFTLHLSGCSSQSTPFEGSHALVYQRMKSGQSVLAAPTLHVKSGSLVIVSVGRGDIRAFEKPLVQQLPLSESGASRIADLGTPHSYSRYPQSGTATYAVTASGPDAASLDISTRTPPSDEVTLAAVVAAGSRVQDFAWNEVLAGRRIWRNRIRSGKVSTTGPATLVAFWWGDAGVRGEKKAVPRDGFQLIDTIGAPGELVQCAVAVKHVAQAGEYDVTWKSTPAQGAQLWLVAVQ
ncbi:MAG: hypothetical protein ABI859_00385 [Pseudomonadota bacterium]